MVTEAMLKTCWYCKTGRAEDGALAAMPIYKKVDFFETHAQQLLDVVKLYEPRKVNLATEIIQKAQSGGHWANYSVIAQIAELLAANQPALAALTQLQEKQYQERIGDIKFQTALMGVPRCPTCKKIHRRVNWVSWVIKIPFLLIGFVAGLGAIAATMAPIGDQMTNMLLGLVAAAIAIASVGIVHYNKQVLDRLFVRGTRREDFGYEFPGVQQRLSAGWIVGRPPVK